MSEGAPVRAFLAVPADPDWVASARELLRGLRSQLPEASWTRPESWHLTLHFLGEIEQGAADRFAEAIAPRVAQTPGGVLAAAGAAVFPPRGPARVLAVGFAASAVTAALSVLVAAARRLAPDPRNARLETRTFHPHITFARLRRPWRPRAVERYCAALDAWRAPAFPVRSCVLFRSRLEAGGAVHTAIWTGGFGAFAGSPVEARP